MFSSLSRYAVNRLSRVSFARHVSFFLLLTALGTANAVIVRGRVTDALGGPVAGSRVQLMQGRTVAAFTISGADGTFEIRSSESGRFTLVGSAAGYLPAIGVNFYGGATDVLEQNVVLSGVTVRQDVSVSATGIATPLPELTAPMTVIPADDLLTRVGVMDELRQSPGLFVVQQGQVGGVGSLFVRGGNSSANSVLIDGIPADDVGGSFDFGTVSSTAITRMEIYRGPNSAMYGTDAGAGVVTIDTPRGETMKPLLTYSGDAGNLHTWRNEVTIGGLARKVDYYGAWSRFDTSNALPRDRFRSQTFATNEGYDFTGSTQMRFTFRSANSTSGLPGGYDFDGGVALDGKEKDQDIYSGVTLEDRRENSWHNLLRYGIARKREQSIPGANEGIPDGFGDFYSPEVTIRGANGYTATGQNSLYEFAYDQASDRDQLYYQSDYSPSVHFNALFGFRYDNERGSFNDVEFSEFRKIKRNNFEYNLQFQGQYFGRLFYSLGGALEKNHLYGVAGTPRLGLSYVPVRPGSGFRGTRLRANVATGVQEPSLALEYSSLYTQLLASGNPTDIADIAKYHIRPESQERSRTYDFGVDQNLDGERLVLKLGYFHNMFDRQLEGVSGSALKTYFGLNIPQASNPYFTAYLNSLAYRTEGEEAELTWQATRHLFTRVNFTHMDSKVLQSFSGDVVAQLQGFPTENPELPGIAIGAESPLLGGRPFRRPPNSGSFDVSYTQRRWNLALKGAFASRSDDSTFLFENDINFGNSLLLPNRDLDFGYLKLDLGGTYQVKRNIAVFAQLDNLLNNQHIGPIGYPGLPLTFRAGVKAHFGGN